MAEAGFGVAMVGTEEAMVETEVEVVQRLSLIHI